MNDRDPDRPERRLPPYRHPDHRRPVTRREFLGQGFITGAAMIAAPTLLGLFRSEDARAQALDCGIGGALGNRIPIVVIDLGGGASTAGSNVLVGTNTQTTGDLTPAGYMKLGLPPAITPPADPTVIDPELGLAFHRDSAMLAGIRARASVGTRANVNGAIFCARSDNDTGNNPHNPMYGLYRSGLDGRVVTLIGSENSESGGRSAAPMSMFDPTVRPTKVDRPEDATGLVDTGRLVQLLSQDDAAAVMLAAQNISDRKVGAITESALVEELIQCGFRETTDLVTRFGNPAAFDPRLDPAVGAIFPEGLGQSDYRKTASVMKLVVNRLAGAGTVEFGGYDYHDGTRATGEAKDFVAGECIGAILEYAATKIDEVSGLPAPTPVVVYVLSDGSVFSDGVIETVNGVEKGIWRGDNSSTAGTFMLVYDPDGRPQMNPAVGNQVGRFKDNGSVDTGFLFADQVTRLAEVIVLNYVALHNDVGSFGSYLTHGLGSNLDAYTAFAPLNRFLS